MIGVAIVYRLRGNGSTVGMGLVSCIAALDSAESRLLPMADFQMEHSVAYSVQLTLLASSRPVCSTSHCLAQREP